MNVQFAIKRKSNNVRVRFKRDGRIIITTGLAMTFEEMRDVLERHLTPPELAAAERLWTVDECQRQFTKKFFTLMLCEKRPENS